MLWLAGGCCVQVTVESEEAVADTGLCRAYADLEVVREFNGGAFGEVAECDRVALRITEPGETGAQLLTVKQRIPLVGVVIHGGMFAFPDAQVAGVARFQAPNTVDRPSVGDGAEPGLQISTGGIEPVGVFPELEERFMNDVFGEVTVTDDRADETTELRRVGPVRMREVGWVADELVHVELFSDLGASHRRRRPSRECTPHSGMHAEAPATGR